MSQARIRDFLGLPVVPASEEIVPSAGLAGEAPACTRSDCESARAETGECHCSIYGADLKPRAFRIGTADANFKRGGFSA